MGETEGTANSERNIGFGKESFISWLASCNELLIWYWGY